jgi:hypothetical protein
MDLRHFSLCAVMALLPLSARAAAPSAAENPGLSLLNNAITFYAGFDSGSASADLANGKADPIALAGKGVYMPGRYGKALLTGVKGGGAMVTYATGKNVDFTAPGALSFWAAPVKWIGADEQPQRPYLHFLSVPARRGSLIIERMGFSVKPKRADRLILGYFNMADLKTAMTGYATLKWQAGDWRLVVMNWDVNGFSTSFNGSAPRRVEFSRRLAQGDFPASGKAAVVQIGNGGGETTLIDELIFYNRTLSAEEIKTLAGK